MLLLFFFNLREERKRVIIKLLVLGCQGKKVQDTKTVFQSTSQFSQTVTQSTGLPVKENTKKKCK